MAFERVTVFCGSSNHVDPHYKAAARETGAWLAFHGIGVVYGGGGCGLMGALADGALASGGEVIGVIPHKLLALELGHTGVTRMEVVPDMHTRKARMAELADAFLALPGGLGTLEELFEALTWAQLRYHDKPVGVLDVGGYWTHLLAFLDRAAADRFVRPAHRNLLQHDDDIAALLAKLEQTAPPELEGWIGDP